MPSTEHEPLTFLAVVLTCRELSPHSLEAVKAGTSYNTSTVTTAAHITGPRAASRHCGIASTSQDQDRTPRAVEPLP
ncbi:unnamed protein product [Lasius platythorax]|uniref:Uncharacterized protein n=1 Tax=Lasius platythorax TaxID=488582 RepID=A0AAV2NQ08_9HYME